MQTSQIAEIEDHSRADQEYKETDGRFSCMTPSCLNQYSLVSFVRFFLCESLVGIVVSSTEMSERLRILVHELILMANHQCLKCVRSDPFTMTRLSSNIGRMWQRIECHHAKRASSVCPSFSHRLPFLEDVIQNISDRRSLYLLGNINDKEVCISLENLLVIAHSIYSDSFEKYERGRVLESKAYENRSKNVSVDGKELQHWKRETNYYGPDKNDCERTGILYPGRIQFRSPVLFDTKDRDAEQQPCAKNYLASRTLWGV